MAKAGVKRPEWMLNPGALVQAMQELFSAGPVNPRTLALTGLLPQGMPLPEPQPSAVPDLTAMREPTQAEGLGLVLDLMAPGYMVGGQIPTRHAMAMALKDFKNMTQVGSEARSALMRGLKKGVTLTEKAFGQRAAGHMRDLDPDVITTILNTMAGERTPQYEVAMDARRAAADLRGNVGNALERLQQRSITGGHELGHILEENLPKEARWALRARAMGLGEEVHPMAMLQASMSMRGGHPGALMQPKPEYARKVFREVLGSESTAYGFEDMMRGYGSSPNEFLELLMHLSQAR